MKPWCIAALIVLVGILTAQNALAVDLINEDSVAYSVLVQDETNQRDVIIAPGEWLLDICQRCHISIKDVGSISAESSDTIIIHNEMLAISN